MGIHEMYGGKWLWSRKVGGDGLRSLSEQVEGSLENHLLSRTVFNGLRSRSVASSSYQILRLLNLMCIMSPSSRFSSIAPTVQNIRANMAAEQQVSAANRRLAQQLANRPGLQASAAGMYQQQRGGGARGNPAMRKMSVQQRLGKSNIKNRLSLPGGGQQRGRGRGRGRGGGLPIQGGGGDMSNRAKGRGGFSPRGSRGRGSIRARGRGVYNRFTGQNTVNRGNRRGGRGGIMRRGGRGQMRGRGGRGGRGGNSNVSVQDLDNQLDEYMSKSKSHLDQELDSYMSEVA